MLCDFYGNVLIPPTVVAHRRPGFQEVVTRLKEAAHKHALGDVLVAVERTGRYHHPVQRAFAAAGYEARIVHPFATKQFRQPADPGVKTDDKDLAAIHRCAVNGFALAEASLDESWWELRLLIRHRRDLVRKASALCCQIREHLDAAMPGYAGCFEKFWEMQVPLHLAWKVGSAGGLRRMGVSGMARLLRKDQVRFQERTLERVLEWAQGTACPDVAAEQHRRIAMALDADRVRKTHEIQALEREIAGRLARTPYVLLLSFPGINVVSAGDFAGEAGPMSHYANSRCITGRAGLYPSRYQSDQVDRADGPLVRCSNRRLRAAILGVADNLILCNRHFGELASRWKAAGKDPRDTHVKVGLRFCRIAFQIVAGQQVFRHPCIQGRSYILQKLMRFHREHGTSMDRTLADLQAAIAQLPRQEHAAEAAPLVEELEAIQNRRRRGPQLIGEVLPLVLARLGVRRIQSPESGARDPI
jgi:transposase